MVHSARHTSRAQQISYASTAMHISTCKESAAGLQDVANVSVLTKAATAQVWTFPDVQSALGHTEAQTGSANDTPTTSDILLHKSHRLSKLKT